MSLSPTSINDPAPHGLLRVEVPHWSAQLTVFNSKGKVVLRPDQALVQPCPPNRVGVVWEVTAPLTPGVYEVELRLNEQSVRQLAMVRDSETCVLKLNDWKSLPKNPVSAMPLADTETLPDAHSRAAHAWSRKLTWKKSVGNSRLFLFVRTLTPKKGSRFYENLSLLDENEKLVTDFSEGIELNEKEGWMAFTANLPSGYYLLKRNRYEQHRSKYQAVYLVPNWETHAFLMAERRPSLQTLALSMAPLGSGFLPADEGNKATVLLANSLSRSINPGRLVLLDAVNRLLGSGTTNPWLNVLRAYIIRLQQEQLANDSAQAEVWPAVLASWPTLMDALKPLDSHPDVQALQLQTTEPAQTPVLYPPLLYAGLRMVQQHSLLFADTVQINSLLKRVLPRVSTTSAWTAWRQTQEPAKAPARKIAPPVEADAASDDVASDSVSSDEADMAQPFINSSTPNFLQFVTPKLPIYQIQSSTTVAQSTYADKPEAPPSMSDLLLTVQTLQASQNLFDDSLESIADTTALGSKAAIADLFGSEQARGISQLSGVPLAQVQNSLTKLQTVCQKPGQAEKTTLSTYDQTVFSYAVQQVLEGMIGDPLLTTIESCVSKLLTEANRLLGQFLVPEMPPDIDRLASRIRGVSDRLLLSARYMVATDVNGKIVLSNGVFVILLKETTQPNTDRVQQWETFLKTAPFGNSALPHELVGKGADAWKLQRTVLHDDEHDQVIHLNTFQNTDGMVLKTGQLKGLESLLPRLVLATASIAYNQLSKLGQEPDEYHQQQQKLDDILTQMEQVLDDLLVMNKTG